MNIIENKIITEDPWQSLKKNTQARIAMGHCGSSIPTNELIQFKLAHAKAIDAVRLPLNVDLTAKKIKKITGLDVICLHSAAKDRQEYLKRPDLGRKLSEDSVRLIQHKEKTNDYDISLVIADGLSSTAVETNISPVFNLLLPELMQKGYSLSPISIVEQGRVAVADHVAELFNAKMTIIFIGERPGLKSSDSLGIYMTYNPKKGTTDERRNCISNVRHKGLSYPSACFKLLYLIEESFRRKLSGVDLKDEQTNQELIFEETENVLL